MFEQMKQEATANKQKIAELTAQLETVDEQVNKEGEGLFAVALGLGIKVGEVEARVEDVEDKTKALEGKVTTLEKGVDELKTTTVGLV